MILRATVRFSVPKMEVWLAVKRPRLNVPLTTCVSTEAASMLARETWKWPYRSLACTASTSRFEKWASGTPWLGTDPDEAETGRWF